LLREYLAPAEAEAAAKALAAGGPASYPLAGGTDLLVQMRGGRAKPSLIVDLKRIPAAMGVRRTDDGGFVIGAATPAAILAEDAALTAAWPGVVEGADLIGSTQVQGRASLGGNLCNASPAADGVPALVAGRAVAVIVGPGGTREAPVEAVATGPGQTSLAPGEIVIEIRLPPRPPRASDAYLRFIPRTEMDIAVAGAAVNLVLDADGRVAEAGVAIGAVAPTVLRVDDAAAALVGSRVDEAALAALDAAVQAAAKPITDRRGTAEFRTQVAGVLARRAALIAYGRAEARK
jgi:carbon-monoxide dehydrogenase medium subunit